MPQKMQRWGNGAEYPSELFSLHHGDLFNKFRDGDAAGVRALLTAQPQWLAYYYWGDSLLHLAVKHDHPDVLAVLVELGMDVNTPKEDAPWGALYDAVLFENLHSVQWLLEHGAHPKYEHNGFTRSCGALSSAAEGNLEMVKLLVEYGAPIDVLVDDPPRSLLTTAIQFGQTEVADYLRSKGALTEDEIKARDAKGKPKRKK